MVARSTQKLLEIHNNCHRCFYSLFLHNFSTLFLLSLTPTQTISRTFVPAFLCTLSHTVTCTFICTLDRIYHCKEFLSVGFKCVNKELCQNGTIVTDGSGLFNVRTGSTQLAESSKCELDMDVCCWLPSLKEKNKTGNYFL